MRSANAGWEPLSRPPGMCGHLDEQPGTHLSKLMELKLHTADLCRSLHVNYTSRSKTSKFRGNTTDCPLKSHFYSPSSQTHWSQALQRAPVEGEPGSNPQQSGRLWGWPAPPTQGWRAREMPGHSLELHTLWGRYALPGEGSHTGPGHTPDDTTLP